MKKMALFLALLMVVLQACALAYPTTVDNVLDSKSKSDLKPVADTAKVAGEVNKGLNKAFEHEPLATIDKARIETYNGAKKATNMLWDVVTFKWLRDKETKD